MEHTLNRQPFWFTLYINRDGFINSTEVALFMVRDLVQLSMQSHKNKRTRLTRFPALTIVRVLLSYVYREAYLA